MRQMRIEGGEAEGQGARRGGAFHPGQQATQLVHHRGAVGAALAKDGDRRGGARHEAIRDLDFFKRDYRTKQEQRKGGEMAHTQRKAKYI